ncbi:carbohydrate esterase family 5 protein [Microdochium bolleyi]|uniref:Cutinase n=1 Tax=Microdochium bolleyi TaxID=196109 RepID=A0A136ILB4_9PEZI|nr:carbohydrate esterase family 5 protein [Microdochium bolleyi]
MKFSAAIVAALSSLAAALPAGTLESRQTVTRRELELGLSSACPKAVFIFARGTTELGNMGATVGPNVADALESRYGNSQVWIQGVGDPYTATTATNLLPDGASTVAINEMVRLVNLSASKCPNAKITVGGYSQGAALTAAAVSKLSSTVSAKVVGAVLFGYTKNLQNGGRIPNFPQAKTAIYCNFGDLVCTGSLVLTAAHFTYGDTASREAPQFLISKIGN